MNYYARYIRTLKTAGEKRLARGLPTFSKMGVVFASKVGTTFRRSADNPLIGFMEGLQFVAGTFDLSQIERIAPRAQLDLFGPMSSYGPRVVTQVERVIWELQKDSYTRRAVLTLVDRDEPYEDRPCTTSLQFMVREQVLETLVTMRSSDAVWGLPYDLIQFSLMSEMVARCTGYPASGLIVHIGDAHLYENTMHLATGFTPWTFLVPENGCTTYCKWREWALEQIPLLSMSEIKQNWSFKQASSSWMS